MNEVTLTLDNEVLKELIMETIKEKMGIELWCDGKFMTVNLMLDEELIDTHTVSLDGNVCSSCYRKATVEEIIEHFKK